MLDYSSFQHLSVLIERDANWRNAIVLLPKDRNDTSNQILVCAHRTTLELRQLPTGKLIQALENSSQQPIRGLLLSPDRKFLFGHGVTELYVWDLSSFQLLYATGECLDEYQGTITSIAFEAERNKLFLGSSNGSRKCWNLKTKRWEMGGFDCKFVKIDRKRNFLIGSYLGNLKRWRLSDMQAFSRGDVQPFSKSQMTKSFAISALTVDYAGSIAYCGYQNGDVELWETNRFESMGVLTRPIEDTDDVEENDPYGDLITTCLALSPDEKVLAIGYATGLIQLYDLTTRKSILTLWEHTTRVQSIIFTQDGKFLLSATGGTVQLWGNPGTLA